MKKSILILTTIFILLSTNSIVFAASVTNEVDNDFYITGGLDFSEDSQATFDKTRTITGKAKEGSFVTITVYEKLLEKQEKLKEMEKYKIVVGASGYFSQTINLVVGENIIKINVKEKNNKPTNVSTAVVRKKSEIKNELEQAIILPKAIR